MFAVFRIHSVNSTCKIVCHNLILRQSINKIQFDRVGFSTFLRQSISLNKLQKESPLKIIISCSFSQKPSGSEAQSNSEDSGRIKARDMDDYDDYEEPKTAGQKVRFYSVVAMRLFLLAVGVGCIIVTARELFPGRMSPNSLYSEAFEYLRNNDELLKITGDPMRAFGRDVGAKTEGRRNVVDSRTYTADDGSKRTRVRFHVKGPKGKARVYVEVSDRMAHNEYVYLICQDAYSGHVITFHDNRARLEAEASMTSSEGKDAMKSLLGSFSGNK